jgi:tRNA dimethylallyltransferase
MNIGTAKPNATQLETIQHYFINTKSVGDLYGAGHYEKDVLKLLQQLFLEHDVVILCGGSGLYMNAVLNGVDEFEEVPSKFRETLNEEFRLHGINWLQNELKNLDPAYYSTVDLNNSQRLIRALEICRFSELPYSSYLEKTKKERFFTAINLFINLNREELYQRINERVDTMMQQGLLQEVKTLLNFREFNALKTVGYKELFEHLDGHLSLEQATDKIKQHTRNYAKRQITWFKNKGNYEEFRPDEVEKIKAYIDIIVTHG